MNQLTPQVTPLATEVINDPTMPAGLFQSYARLFAAAAAHDFQHTGPLDFESQVVPLLGLRRSQARQHLQALRFAKLLDWSTDGGNRYVFRFKSGNPDSVGDGVVDSAENLPEEIQQQQQPSEKPEPPTGPGFARTSPGFARTSPGFARTGRAGRRGRHLPREAAAGFSAVLLPAGQQLVCSFRQEQDRAEERASGCGQVWRSPGSARTCCGF